MSDRAGDASSREGRRSPGRDALCLTVASVLGIRDANGSLRPATVDDLTVGAEVRVWHTGAIAESCPAQGVATTVEIVEG